MKNSEPQVGFIWPSWQFFALLTIGSTILGAIALPNLLVSCACETPEDESKNRLGAMLRAQQTVFAETGRFPTTFEDLEVPMGNERFYTFQMVEGEMGLIIAKGIDNGKNATKDYIGGINYNPKKRLFSTVVCVATTESNSYTIVNPTEAISNYGIFDKEEEPIVVETAPKVTITQSFQNSLKKLTEKIGIFSDTDEREMLTDREKVKCEKGVEAIQN